MKVADLLEANQMTQPHIARANEKAYLQRWAHFNPNEYDVHGEPSKERIVKELLRKLNATPSAQMSWEKNTLGGILRVIKYYRKHVGVDYPEFAAIEKSVRHMLDTRKIQNRRK